MRPALLLVAVLGFGVFASSAAEPVSKEFVRQAITVFRAEPHSEKGRAAAALILRFAEESPDVEVVVSPKTLPWMGSDLSPEYGAKMLVAYAAGSIRSQLDRKVTKDDDKAGMAQVVETYLFLQKKDPELRIPVIEAIIARKKQEQPI